MEVTVKGSGGGLDLEKVDVINCKTAKNFKLYLKCFKGIITDRVHVLDNSTKEIWEPVYKEAGFKILELEGGKSIAYESDEALNKVSSTL